MIERFLSGFDGAEWVPFELFDDEVLRTANLLSFGHKHYRRLIWPALVM